jgi:hypothetical protein
MIYLLAAVGILVLLVYITGFDYQLKRALRFHRRRLGHRIEPATFSFLQGDSKRKVPLNELRDFVMSLQLATSMEAGLAWALDRAADQFADRGVLGDRLERHVESRLSVSSEAVFQGLVEDFDNPYFVELLERVRAAEEGGIPYSRVFALTSREIQEDIRSEVEQSIERAPTRLTPIMLLGLLTPVLILGLAPLLGLLPSSL